MKSRFLRFLALFLAVCGIATAGTPLTDPIVVGSLKPKTNDGAAIGDTTHNFSDLFLASGAVINYANSDVVLTHSTGLLTLGTGDLRITNAGTNTASVVTLGGAQTLTNKVLTSATVVTSFLPSTDDGAAIGDTTHNFSDLFLASGAVINYANGNVALTHSSGVLTLGTGDLRITTAGSNSASVVTVGGTQTLTSKTLTSPTLTTPALGTPSSGTLTNCTGLPYSTGITAPASFSVNKGGTDQTAVASGAFRLVTWSTEEWDTANAFASNRHTPNVAGKYEYDAGIYWLDAGGGLPAEQQLVIGKNGTDFWKLDMRNSAYYWTGGRVTIPMNGTTDYVELYVYFPTGANVSLYGAVGAAHFQGAWKAP